MGRPALRTEVFFGQKKFAVLVKRHGSAAKVYDFYRHLLYPTIRTATRLSMLVGQHPARQEEIDCINAVLLEGYWKPLWHLRKISGGRPTLDGENVRAAALSLCYDPDTIQEDIE